MSSPVNVLNETVCVCIYHQLSLYVSIVYI